MTPGLSAANLRAQFKVLPVEQRNVNQPFVIRVWRGLSWLEKSESFPPTVVGQAKGVGSPTGSRRSGERDANDNSLIRNRNLRRNCICLSTSIRRYIPLRMPGGCWDIRTDTSVRSCRLR